MKVLVVASTRPEVIKLAPVLKELISRDIGYVFATTGQHYDYLLFKRFIEDLGLEEPIYNIGVGSETQAIQTGKIMAGIEELLLKENPDVVIVEGDTNSVLGTALAAAKLKIAVAHVEAGLRSNDRTMPEEINRILTDHCSEILFAPTENSALNLVNEGVPPRKIHVVGNTIADATLSNIEAAEKKSKILDELPNDYILFTLHRQENTDDPERLRGIFTALKDIKRNIVFPIHPRTSKVVQGTDMERLIKAPNIHVIEPLGYLDFIVALKNAFSVFTDSGGIQEEAIILGTPCLTLRYNTERPETVWAGGNKVIGTRKEDIIEGAALLEDADEYNKMKSAKNPFGDGKTGERIVQVLIEKQEKDGFMVELSDTRAGFYSKKLLSIDKNMAGKMVKDVEYEIIKIISGEIEKFPFQDSILIEGDFIEVIQKG